ncbi:MAG: type II toxin-antitoxin system VapC family toxin [Candidatus Magnetomorum sp.]|nr:type II toxin-antitoxin system VapC family toxin [Candidatus Magnetomorum sp.]
MADSRILIDTSVIIDFLRKKNKQKSVLWRIKEKYECLISTVTLFELQCGSKTEQHEKDIHKLLKWIETIPFDENISDISATIFQDLRAKNQLIEFRDIFIAATAISGDLSLATFNLNHFKRIQNLSLLNTRNC